MHQVVQRTGSIFLQKTSYKLTVMAKDKGTPPLNSTASVTIKVAVGTSSPPTWDQNYDSMYYSVSETDVSARIATMKCNSNIEDDRVEFQIIGEDGSSSQSTGTFSISYVGNTLYLNVDGKLDYEKISSYTVRLRCLVSAALVFLYVWGVVNWGGGGGGGRVGRVGGVCMCCLSVCVLLLSQKHA